MLEDGGEIVTLLTGEDALEDVTEKLVGFIHKSYPGSEIEVHPGGQPIYPYILSVE
jgi:dihydroxyacetone kinase-like predicted kinase